MHQYAIPHGKGAFNGTDERYSGMLGMHGTKASNLGVSHCDLLIAVGTRFSDRVLGNPKTLQRMQRFYRLMLTQSRSTRIFVYQLLSSEM